MLRMKESGWHRRLRKRITSLAEFWNKAASLRGGESSTAAAASFGAAAARRPDAADACLPRAALWNAGHPYEEIIAVFREAIVLRRCILWSRKRAYRN